MFVHTEYKDGDIDSMFPIWTRLLWSLWFCYLGIHPTVGQNNNPWPKGSIEEKKAGAPLAGGFFMLIWRIKGDLDHLAK
eukprot:8354396-Alexandrium_andersonii.AAC.1